MTFFEKLLMIAIPLIGLSAILAFFNYYASNLENKTINENQRLQGHNYTKKVGNPTVNYTRKPISKPRKKVITNNDFISWSDNDEITYMSQSQKNHRYKPSKDNYLPPVTPIQKVITYKSKQKNNSKKITKKLIDSQCEYILKMKKRAEDNMKRGYKASQYDYLEGNRKYWAKKYSNNCFNR